MSFDPVRPLGRPARKPNKTIDLAPLTRLQTRRAQRYYLTHLMDGGLLLAVRIRRFASTRSAKKGSPGRLTRGLIRITVLLLRYVCSGGIVFQALTEIKGTDFYHGRRGWNGLAI
jgi:hypothetical protein